MKFVIHKNLYDLVPHGAQSHPETFGVNLTSMRLDEVYHHIPDTGVSAVYLMKYTQN